MEEERHSVPFRGALGEGPKFLTWPQSQMVLTDLRHLATMPALCPEPHPFPVFALQGQGLHKVLFLYVCLYPFGLSVCPVSLSLARAEYQTCGS